MKTHLTSLLAILCMGFASIVRADIPTLWLAVNDGISSSSGTHYVGLYENGELKSRFNAPEVPVSPQSHTVRDLVRGQDGTIWVFNHASAPTLWQIMPTGEQAEYSFEGWSLARQLMRGGIAISGRYVYLTDNDTHGSGSNRASGVVRFNIETKLWDRFANGFDSFDLAIMDGQIYVINQFGTIEVYDENSLQRMNIINLPPMYYWGIAVARDGDIFVTTRDAHGMNAVARFSPEGRLRSYLVLNGYGNLGDIDISPTGAVAIGTATAGKVIITDTDLRESVDFEVPTNSTNATIFVAFADVPSPSAPRPVPTYTGSSVFKLTALIGRP